MKRVFVVLMVLCLAIAVQSQNLLSSQWKFNTGDDPAWAGKEFDHKGWSSIIVGISWENQGLTTYDGFAWYRQKVMIPESLKEEAQVNGGLVLNLGKIDDADVTYLNGTELGHTGQMPPNYETAYGKHRAYMIPVDRILWGKENTIAVRVFDGGGGGGIIGVPVGLSVIGFNELVEITAEMERQDHLFLQEGSVKFKLRIGNNMKHTLKGDLAIVAKSDFGAEVLRIEKKVTVKPGKAKAIPLNLGKLDPGFYNLSCILKSESDSKQVKVALGVRPEEIVSPLDRPEDFDDYWKRARRELDAVAPQFKLIKQDSFCTASKDVYLLEMRSLGNILVRAWYTRPIKEGIYPAILHVQGYSTSMMPNVNSPGENTVDLVLNIRGHGNSRDHVNPGFPGYLQHHLDDKELYIYRGAYMDCVRAVDFLFSRNEVDKKRVAVEGGSQGGALSFATAALDNERISLCVPHVPFLSDFRDYFKVAGWPGNEFKQYFKKNPGIPQDEIFKTLSYIDIKNLAPWIKAPVLMSVGLKDETCPPHINFAAYNQLNVPKSYIAYPESGHGLPGIYNKILYDYIWKEFDIQ